MMTSNYGTDRSQRWSHRFKNVISVLIICGDILVSRSRQFLIATRIFSVGKVGEIILSDVETTKSPGVTIIFTFSKPPADDFLIEEN